ncbi:MAG: alpha-galactosidase [Fimbriimonadaceae bacterium]|nr:alpha-galactosidase [Fimbriimonadaceae bacterium]
MAEVTVSDAVFQTSPRFGPVAVGALTLTTNTPEGQPYNARVRRDGRLVRDWTLRKVERSERTLDAEFESATGLLHRSVWSRDVVGVWSRRDTIENRGQACTIQAASARLVLPPARYEAWAQSARWCGENQTTPLPLTSAEIALSHVPGRTTDGSTPALWIRDLESDGLALHLIPNGNWTIRLTPFGGPHYGWLIDAGFAEGDLERRLAQGESMDLPELWLTAFRQRPEDSAEQIQRMALKRAPAKVPPLLYNTWFDRFDNLERENLTRQLASAKELGAETFVVDAGWYGEPRSWWSQAGEWFDGPKSALAGGLGDFAEEVRAAGLGFGLWMEPERSGSAASIRREHPDWLPNNARGDAELDLVRPEVRDYLDGQIRRLLDTYRLSWIKLDYNFALGPDPRSAEHAGYLAAWYEILSGLRRDYPDTFFEGCASGAMRCDLAAATRYDGYFLSDTVNPWDMVSIAHDAALRLPLGRLGRWAVLRERDGLVEVPSGAGWDPREPCDPAFAMAFGFFGSLGLSGDVASLGGRARESVRGVALEWKRHRAAIVANPIVPLTPFAPLGDRHGWRAVQGSGAEDSVLLGVYRLEDDRGSFRVRPNLPSETGVYRVESVVGEVAERRLSADAIRELGIEVTIPDRNSARVLRMVAD